MIRAALVALLAAGAPAQAADGALYPAAQCAAFWLGWDDIARASAFLDARDDDLERAQAFRAAAIRLGGGDVSAIDRFIAQERPGMALMVEAALYGDKISERAQQRLLQTCADFAATQPETRDLP